MIDEALKPSAIQIFAIVTVFLASCQTTPQPSCTLPQEKNVDRAFSHARVQLAQRECHFRFDEYFQALLMVASGDPNQKNSEHFSEFLLWANEQDIITRVSAKEYYNRYFGTKFVSLPNEYSNCSYTCKVQDEITRKMQNELRDKETGLLKITNDKRRFAEANLLYQSTLTLLDATCEACASAP